MLPLTLLMGKSGWGEAGAGHVGSRNKCDIGKRLGDPQDYTAPYSIHREQGPQLRAQPPLLPSPLTPPTWPVRGSPLAVQLERRESLKVTFSFLRTQRQPR